MKTKEEIISQVLPALNAAQEHYLTACREHDSVGKAKWSDEFRLNALEIKMSGFKLAKKKGYENGIFQVIWRLRGESGKSWKSFGKWVEFSPVHTYKANGKCQCTTRCLFFCMEEAFSYDSIRREQERLAEVHHTKWNCEKAWGKFLTTHGFVKIELNKKIRRDRLAQRLKDIDARMCVHSSHHVSAIYKGDVYDSWDSRRGFADSLYVRKEHKSAVYEKLLDCTGDMSDFFSLDMKKVKLALDGMSLGE